MKYYKSASFASVNLEFLGAFLYDKYVVFHTIILSMSQSRTLSYKTVSRTTIYSRLYQEENSTHMSEYGLKRRNTPMTHGLKISGEKFNPHVRIWTKEA